LGFLRQFFQGRNGTDALNVALAVTAIVLTLLSQFMFGRIFSTLAYMIMFWCVFRMVSRNLPKRQQENQRFLQLTKGRFKRGPKKDHQNFRYLKCPNCKQALRVPKGKGQVKITCSKCELVFYKRV